MKKLMKGAVLGTLASVLLLSGCSNEQAAPANEEKRVHRGQRRCGRSGYDRDRDRQ